MELALNIFYLSIVTKKVFSTNYTYTSKEYNTKRKDFYELPGYSVTSSEPWLVLADCIQCVNMCIQNHCVAVNCFDDNKKGYNNCQLLYSNGFPIKSSHYNYWSRVPVSILNIIYMIITVF